jgi:hypothetical protein
MKTIDYIGVVISHEQYEYFKKLEKKVVSINKYNDLLNEIIKLKKLNEELNMVINMKYLRLECTENLIISLEEEIFKLKTQSLLDFLTDKYSK